MTGYATGGHIGPGLGMRPGDRVFASVDGDDWRELGYVNADGLTEPDRDDNRAWDGRALADAGRAACRSLRDTITGALDRRRAAPRAGGLTPRPGEKLVPHRPAEGAQLRAAVWRAHIGPAVWRVTPYIAREDLSAISVILRPLGPGAEVVGPDRMFLEHADAIAYAHELTHPATITRRTS